MHADTVKIRGTAGSVCGEFEGSGKTEVSTTGSSANRRRSGLQEGCCGLENKHELSGEEVRRRGSGHQQFRSGKDTGDLGKAAARM